MNNSAVFNPMDFKVWSATHAFACLVGCILFVSKGSGIILAVTAMMSFGFLLHTHLTNLSTNGFIGGLANQVTLLRFILILPVLLFLQHIPAIWVCVLFLSVVLLDVLDGYLARKLQVNSLFGMHFDMEVDAFFVLVAGCYFYSTTDLGFVLLLPGALRYIYGLLIFLFPQKHFVEKKRKYAAWAAGFNFCLLVAATVAQDTVQDIILLISCMTVCLSFAVSFYEYFSYDRIH